MFVLGLGGGNDTIADFSAGAGTDDRIDISAFGFSSFANVISASTDAGVNMTIDLDGLPGGDELFLSNVNIADLDSSDFIL